MIDTTRTARDSQRQKVYNAENSALRYIRDIPEYSYPSVAEMQVAVDKICSAKWYRKHNWPSHILVKDGRGQRRALAWSRTISMPKWSRHLDVILHEIAHCCTIMQYGSKYQGVPAHGWQFCAVELELVRHFLGQEAHDRLKAEYKAGRVRFTEPKKRKPLSEEQKAVLRARLEVARAAKAERSRNVVVTG